MRYLFVWGLLIDDQHADISVFEQIFRNEIECVEPAPRPTEGANSRGPAQIRAQFLLHIPGVDPSPDMGGADERDINVRFFLEDLPMKERIRAVP